MATRRMSAKHVIKIVKRPENTPRRRNERHERLVVYLPPELVTELRERCARDRTSLSHAVTDYVRYGLDRL
jgi:hypothetical protein